MPNTTCCNDPDVAFTMAFHVPGSPRVPSDGAPISAYFDNIVVAGPGFEMDHPLTRSYPQLVKDLTGVITPTPIDEGLSGIRILDDEDACDKPQLAFAIGATLSGS